MLYIYTDISAYVYICICTPSRANVPQSVWWGFERWHTHPERVGIESWTAFLCTSAQAHNSPGELWWWFTEPCYFLCVNVMNIQAWIPTQQHPLRISAASSFVNFCSKLASFRRDPCLCTAGQEHCATVNVPGVYGISALAYGQGRGLKQQRHSDLGFPEQES